MVNNDRVGELYLGEIFDAAQQMICRRRVHWMCGQVVGWGRLVLRIAFPFVESIGIPVDEVCDLECA